MSSEYEYESTEQAVGVIFYAEPPEHIRSLVESLFRAKYAEEGCPQNSISAEEIPADALQILNAFAASVAQVSDCKVTAIDGCGACRTGGQPGYLVRTPEGSQCWSPC